jgi:hypothetical protein
MPAQGTLGLYLRDEKVGKGLIRTQPGKFGLGGGAWSSDARAPSPSPGFRSWVAA